jgi:hypothetical protein
MYGKEKQTRNSEKNFPSNISIYTLKLPRILNYNYTVQWSISELNFLLYGFITTLSYSEDGGSTVLPEIFVLFHTASQPIRSWLVYYIFHTWPKDSYCHLVCNCWQVNNISYEICSPVYDIYAYTVVHVHSMEELYFSDKGTTFFIPPPPSSSVP